MNRNLPSVAQGGKSRPGKLVHKSKKLSLTPSVEKYKSRKGPFLLFYFSTEGEREHVQ